MQRSDRVPRQKRREPGCMSQVVGCTGECCREFCLGRNTQESLVTLLDVNSEEHRKIAASVVFIEEREGVARWTCRHWDRKSKLCHIYSSRPAMCREYPYGGKCEHCGMELETRIGEQAESNRL